MKLSGNEQNTAQRGSGKPGFMAKQNCIGMYRLIDGRIDTTTHQEFVGGTFSGTAFCDTCSSSAMTSHPIFFGHKVNSGCRLAFP